MSECLLQTKADGQTGRARENRKCGKIDTRYVDADKKGDNDDCERRQFLREQFLCRIKVADSRNAMFCNSVCKPYACDQRHDGYRKRKHAEQRETGVAYIETYAFQDRKRVVRGKKEAVRVERGGRRNL